MSAKSDAPFVLPSYEDTLEIVKKGGDAFKDLAIAVLKNEGHTIPADILEEEWFRWSVDIDAPYGPWTAPSWDFNYGKRGIDLTQVEVAVEINMGKRLGWTTPYRHDRDFGDIVFDAVCEAVADSLKEDL